MRTRPLYLYSSVDWEWSRCASTVVNFCCITRNTMIEENFISLNLHAHICRVHLPSSAGLMTSFDFAPTCITLIQFNSPCWQKRTMVGTTRKRSCTGSTGPLKQERVLNQLSDNTSIPPRSKRSKNTDGEDDRPEAMHRQTNVNDEEESQATSEQEGGELSTQSISFVQSCWLLFNTPRVLTKKSCSELETDITTFIRNTAKNDSWPVAFQKHVGERESELLEQISTGTAKRFCSYPGEMPLHFH